MVWPSGTSSKWTMPSWSHQTHRNVTETSLRVGYVLLLVTLFVRGPTIDFHRGLLVGYWSRPTSYRKLQFDGWSVICISLSSWGIFRQLLLTIPRAWKWRTVEVWVMLSLADNMRVYASGFVSIAPRIASESIVTCPSARGYLLYLHLGYQFFRNNVCSILRSNIVTFNITYISSLLLGSRV